MQKEQENTYQIFGRNVKLICLDEDLSTYINEELSLYKSENSDDSDLTISILEELPEVSGSRNPKSHFEDNQSILVKNKQADILFRFKNNTLEEILFSLNKPAGFLKGRVQKFLHMGNRNRIERVGQILHELVLTSFGFFFSDTIPVHSSGLSIRDKVVLFGGTGGVGKTSLELELCLKEGAEFIADDIAMISKEGKVYPNYSYPKIYGYNVEGDEELKKRLFPKFNFLESFHWWFHYKMGPNKVRRRLSPDRLFNHISKEPKRLTNYYILSAYHGHEIETEVLDPEISANITTDIIETEFSFLLSHLSFHRLNAKVNNMPPLFLKEIILERWKAQLETIFKNVECTLVKIPIGMEHAKFKKDMVDLILKD